MSHAHGVTLNGSGLHRFADAAIWSFNSTKQLQCGEGGVAWFSQPKDVTRARDVTHAKISEFAAAVMRSEIINSTAIYAAHAKIAGMYEKAGIPGLYQNVPGLRSTFARYVVPTNQTRFGEHSAPAIMEALRDRGVICQPPEMRDHICLPIDRFMTEEDARCVIDAWTMIK